MRKLIVAEFISVDGVVEAPETWHFPYANHEVFAAMAATAEECDTMLLGRVTYEGYASAFATAPDGDPIGDLMNRPTKIVATRTLSDLAWRNSQVLAGDLVPAVAALKAQPGTAILLTGSVGIAQALLAADLVDELNLLVDPVVLGAGRRLFAPNGLRRPLELVSGRAFGTGVIHQIYRPA